MDTKRPRRQHLANISCKDPDARRTQSREVEAVADSQAPLILGDMERVSGKGLTFSEEELQGPQRGPGWRGVHR